MVNPTPLKRNDNVSILNAIRDEASGEYQSRIPEATQGSIQNTLANLVAFRPQMNEFVSALVNRIGVVIAKNNAWTNPLAEFKRGMLPFGSTIEEIQTGLLKAKTYDPDRDQMEQTLFSTEVPPVKSLFHTINRQNMYKVTVNDMLLRRAFITDTGISDFLGQLMQSPSTSDSWDEFILITKLFSIYEKLGGFFHVYVPEIRDDETDVTVAKTFLKRVRSTAGNLKFLSTRYNAAHMPISAQPEELILFTTPEFNAAMDVDALSAAFNMDRAKANTRIIEIPAEYFGIDGCQAILTTRDFFVIADTLFEATAQWNPASLNTNHFLHHHSIISTSLFAPAVMFTSNGADVIIATPQNITTVSAITIEPVDGAAVTEAVRGGMIALLAEGVDANDNINSGVRWTVTGNSSVWTYITPEGNLHVAADETASELTVTAIAAWVNPANPRSDSPTASLAVTVAAEPAAGELWPETGAVTSIMVKDTAVPVVAGTTAYTVVMPELTALGKNDILVESTGVSVVSVTVAKNAALGWIATIVTDAGPSSAPITYVVTVNLA